MAWAHLFPQKPKQHLELSTLSRPINQLTSCLFLQPTDSLLQIRYPRFPFPPAPGKTPIQNTFAPFLFKLVIIKVGGVLLFLHSILESEPHRCGDERAGDKTRTGSGPTGSGMAYRGRRCVRAGALFLTRRRRARQASGDWRAGAPRGGAVSDFGREWKRPRPLSRCRTLPLSAEEGHHGAPCQVRGW